MKRSGVRGREIIPRANVARERLRWRNNETALFYEPLLAPFSIFNIFNHFVFLSYPINELILNDVHLNTIYTFFPLYNIY
jgi:hypothetical protein